MVDLSFLPDKAAPDFSFLPDKPKSNKTSNLPLGIPSIETLGREPGLEAVGLNQALFMPPASELRESMSSGIQDIIGNNTQIQRDIGKVASYAPHLLPLNVGETVAAAAGGKIISTVGAPIARAAGSALDIGLTNAAGKMITPEAQMIGDVGAGMASKVRFGGGFSKIFTEEAPKAAASAASNVVTKEVSPEVKAVARSIVSGDIRSINTKYIASVDAKQVIDEISPIIKGDVEKQARGVIPMIETQKMAAELGVTPEQISKSNPGTIVNAETMYAFRSIMESSALKVKDLSTAYTSAQDPIVKSKAFADLTSALSDHMTIQTKVTGIAAEIGRALRQQQYFTPGKAETAIIKSALGDINNLADEATVKRLADTLSTLGDNPAAAAAAISKTFSPTIWDKIIEFSTAVKMSGPTTIFKNTVGNSLGALTRISEKTGAPFIDFFRTGGGKITDRSVYFGEIPAEIVGYWQGLPKAAKVAMAELKKIATGEVASGIPNAEVAAKKQAIGGIMGKVIRIPFNVSSAADQFFGTFIGEGALNSYAYRRAASEGLSGMDLIRRTFELAKSPTQAMLADVDGVVKEFTYRSELGNFGKSLNTAKNSNFVARLLVPFFQTPVNLAKFGVHRGLSITTPRFWNEITKGGEKATEAATRALIGGAAAASFFKFAMDGYITGSPSKNPAEADANMRPGSAGYRPPYSIKIGDKWVEYRSFEPYATLLATAADAADSVINRKELGYAGMAGKMATSVTKNMLNQSYMQGVSDLLDALDDPEVKGSKLIGSVATGAMIPGVVAQMARAGDPYIRKPGDFEDTLKAKIPGMSEDVTPKRNVFGEPYERQYPLSPLTIRKQEETSKLEQWLADHDMDTKIGFPSKHLAAVGRKLSPEDYDRMLTIAGPSLKSSLIKMMTDTNFNNLTYDEQVKSIKRAVVKSHALVTPYLIAPTELRYLGLLPTQEFSDDHAKILTKIVTNKIYKRLQSDELKRDFIERALKTSIKRGPGIIDKIAAELLIQNSPTPEEEPIE
jgi:hypothetical protein